MPLQLPPNSRQCGVERQEMQPRPPMQCGIQNIASNLRFLRWEPIEETPGPGFGAQMSPLLAGSLRLRRLRGAIKPRAPQLEIPYTQSRSGFLKAADRRRKTFPRLFVPKFLRKFGREGEMAQ